MSDKNKPRPVPSKQPGGSKKSGPSMKEQLMARRRAAADAEERPAKEAPDRVVRGPAKGTGAVKRAAGAKAPGAIKPGNAVKSTPGRTTATGKKQVTRSSRAGATRAGGRAGRRGASPHSEDDASDVRKRLRENRRKSPMPFVLVGALVLVGGGGIWYLMQPDPEPEDGGTVQAAGGADAAGDDAAEGADGEQLDVPETGAAAAGEGDPADATGDAAGDEPDTDPDEGTSAPARRGDPESSIALAVTRDSEDKNNPANIDLTKLTPHGKPPALSEEEWASLVEDAQTFLDPGAGAAGNRARRRLEEAGIVAWPAIGNEMLKLDVARPEDNQTGMIAQRALDGIRGGTTGYAFDWRTPEASGEVLDPAQQWVNKFTIVNIHEVWRKHLADPNYFRNKIAKGTVKEEMDAAAGGGDGGLDVDALDLGDLDGIGG